MSIPIQHFGQIVSKKSYFYERNNRTVQLFKLKVNMRVEEGTAIQYSKPLPYTDINTSNFFENGAMLWNNNALYI